MHSLTPEPAQFHPPLRRIKAAPDVRGLFIPSL